MIYTLYSQFKSLIVHIYIKSINHHNLMIIYNKIPHHNLFNQQQKKIYNKFIDIYLHDLSILRKWYLKLLSIIQYKLLLFTYIFPGWDKGKIWIIFSLITKPLYIINMFYNKYLKNREITIIPATNNLQGQLTNVMITHQY